MFRTETTNDPAMIAVNPMMISINAAVQIDLFAQANASYVGGRIFSGFGGQTDFIVGALHSAGGQAVIGLPSWHEKSKSSTIVPLLDMPATSFQHSVVVTDQGCAHVFGRSQHDQARLLIEEAAAPQARDELWDAAERLGLADSESGTKPPDDRSSLAQSRRARSSTGVSTRLGARTARNAQSSEMGSSSSAKPPAPIGVSTARAAFSATRLRIRWWSSTMSSGLSRRNCLAFSRPWPSCSPS